MNSPFDYAAYWRASLADAALGTGSFRPEDLAAMWRCLGKEWTDGTVSQGVVQLAFEGVDDDIDTVEVLLRPAVFHKRHDHGVQRLGDGPEYLLPVVCNAALHRSGRLSPGRVRIARELLEPLGTGSFAIGEIAKQDDFLDANAEPMFSAGPQPARDHGATGSSPDWYSSNWTAYRNYCAHLLAAVAAEWDPHADGYRTIDHWYVTRADSAHKATLGLLGLYDHLHRNQPDTPLFARYAGDLQAQREPCLPVHDEIAARVGHGTADFPLASAQRRCLNHVLRAQDGEIIALNGPPGTGKTTMLLSVVASLWVQAALDGKDAPVIVAASANNQAVTNIINAFGQDLALDGALGGRWLPELRSYGSYFPAQFKTAAAEQHYHTQQFFAAIERAEYVEHAQTIYLQHAAAAYPGLATVAEVVAHLRAQMLAIAADLSRVEGVFKALHAARSACSTELGCDPPGALAARAEQQRRAAAALHDAKRMRDEWHRFLASEPIWYSLFNWLKPVERKRNLRAAVHLRSIWCGVPELAECSTMFGADDAVEALLAQCEATLVHDSAAHARALELVHAEGRYQEEWRALCGKLGIGLEAAASIELADASLDTTVRYQLFQLATHYWEGRWLAEMDPLRPQLDSLARKTGAATVMPRWRRRMQLTPCAVSTFYMLPSLMAIARKEDVKFVPDYLYNFIDLLIVDEAGQALPQIAGPAFALARRALVIGDARQIEPIWSIPKKVDVGNLLELGLLPGSTAREAYRTFSASGRSAANGSVMRVAQHACRYHENPELDPGLYLYEHRRCWDGIIAYSDQLCYREKLIKCRGSAPADAPLPAMGYLHIDGRCEQANGGSRHNRTEAATIAAWLAAERARLEAAYGQPLEQLAAIITPFGAQVRVLAAACAHAGIKVGKEEGAMTIGTVHALQGAERKVVLFSPVYSKHDNGKFIDRSPSMLNVAVSRAKDSFLLFGDMDVLEEASRTSPRGLLAQFLLREPGNRLVFEMAVTRADLIEQRVALTQLRDAAEHDAFLLATLQQATSEVHIVSPWISEMTMVSMGAWDAMRAAVQRGVRVVVYTDVDFNTDGPDHVAKRNRFDRTVGRLAGDGVETVYVNRLHSKIVMADRIVYCVGSFNWLSAVREGDYKRHETSLLYRGDGLASEIEVAMQSLVNRELTRLPQGPGLRPETQRKVARSNTRPATPASVPSKT